MLHSESRDENHIPTVAALWREEKAMGKYTKPDEEIIRKIED
jgi:hypothetical protein